MIILFFISLCLFKINVRASDIESPYFAYVIWHEDDKYDYVKYFHSETSFGLLIIRFDDKTFGVNYISPVENDTNIIETAGICYDGNYKDIQLKNDYTTLCNHPIYTFYSSVNYDSSSFSINRISEDSKIYSNVPIYEVTYEDFKNADTVKIKQMDSSADGSIVPLEKLYDLEIPQNVNVDVSGKKTTITWEQSDDVDVQGWETEIYVNQTGYTKKQYWSKKIKYDSNWLFADEVLNYKNKYSYNGIMMPVVEEYLKNKLGYDPHVREVQKSNFMIRNKYVDETTGITHYSNFVKFDQDGNAYVYYATEVSSEKVQDLIGKGEDITSDALDEATDTNSEYYNGEQTSSFNQATNVDITDFFSGFSNAIGNIPDLFNKIFSFLPDECLLFVALGISVVVLLRILGR